MRFPAGVRGKVFTRAMLAAADHLGMTDNEVVAATGISHAQLFRMRNNKDSLSPHSPLWDKAWLLIRLQQEVSEYCHRDRETMRWWLHRPCRTLRCVPSQRLKRSGGLEWIIENLERLKSEQISLGDPRFN